VLNSRLPFAKRQRNWDYKNNFGAEGDKAPINKKAYRLNPIILVEKVFSQKILYWLWLIGEKKGDDYL